MADNVLAHIFIQQKQYAQETMRGTAGDTCRQLNEACLLQLSHKLKLKPIQVLLLIHVYVVEPKLSKTLPVLQGRII